MIAPTQEEYLKAVFWEVYVGHRRGGSPLITYSFLIGVGLVLTGAFAGALQPSRAKPVTVEACKDRSGQSLSRCGQGVLAGFIPDMT